MRSKDPELMERIKAFIESYYEDYGKTPTNKVIADKMRIGRSTAYYYLVEMAKRNIISYIDGIISTAKIDKYMQPVNHAALVGGIPCGEPDEREEMVEEYIPLPVSIFGEGDFYILRAQGSSMMDAGIDSGDLVVIQKQQTAEIGEIIVALTDDNENTLKRLQYDDELGRYYLHPENPAYEDIYVDGLQIQGVARHVIKAL